MLDAIYTKTEKGRDEIAHRSQLLQPRLRTLLLLIDGKHDSQDLLKQVESLGLNQTHLFELNRLGYITEIVAQPKAIDQQTVSHEARLEEVSTNVPNLPRPEILNQSTDAEKYKALYALFTELIKVHLGLRGFRLQLKVEKASSVEDFLNLRLNLITALIKASGRDIGILAHDKFCKIYGQQIREDF